MYIIFFIIILVCFYFFNKWIQTKTPSFIKGRNIRVIERIQLDKDKSFILMARGEKVYLIGVTQNQMTVLDTLTKDEISVNGENEKKLFDSFLRRFQGAESKEK